VDVLVKPGSASDQLSQADFEVRDNGERRTATLLDTRVLPINVILVLDTSRSAASYFQDLRASVAQLRAQLRPADQIGLVSFSDVVDVDLRPTKAHWLLSDALGRIIPYGRTSLFDAVVASMALSHSVAGRTLVVVVSDGIDNSSFTRRRSVEAAIRAYDGVIYTVLFGRGRDMDGLAAITGGEDLIVKTPAQTGTVLLRALEQFRRRYVLSVPLGSTAIAGWHRLEVKVRKGELKAKYRSGYWMPESLTR